MIYIYNKSSGRVEVNGGRQKVYHTLWLLNGEYRTNDSLSMSSDASGDSRIAPINGATITGKVYVQRYVDAGATNWRFLTAPTQGLALNDWQDNFVMSGFPGSHWPTFPFTSVYSYDESAPGTEDDGFVPASDISQTVAMGQGLWVWCGDSLNGTDPFEIDGRGPVYTGDLDLPVTYTSHGTPSGDGWNMAANPYVSAIDWNSANWTKSHINNAVYIWNPDAQNFAGYVGGVSVNGGSRYIASSQAFWVQANAASPLLRITENCKTAQAAAFRSEEQGPEDILRLRVIGTISFLPSDWPLNHNSVNNEYSSTSA